jgi:glycine oxidase
VLALAIEIAPALARAAVLETWSNFRPASPDGWPVLGAAAAPGLFHATGHTRNGILLCPVTADAVSAAILGRPPPVDLGPFSAARLATRPSRR